MIDLDANATTQPTPEVLEELVRVATDFPGNPGSRHALGRSARRVLEECRERIADRLGAEPDEVVFTGGGTESSNLALLGLAVGGRGVIASPEGEHPATANTITHLTVRGWRTIDLPVDRHGQIVPEFPVELEQDGPKLVTTIYAHNETGVIRDLKPLTKFCEQHRIPLHLDAVQAVGKIPVRFHELNVTTLAFGAHKFHGPRGIGGLLVRRGVRLNPISFGGRQEEGRRPGTESVALVAAMAKALELATDDFEKSMRRVARLRDRLETQLLTEAAPATVHGAETDRLPNTCNIAFLGVPGEALLAALDLEGIACSLGTTCASGSAEPAGSLLAMGVSASEALSSLRLSLHRFLTEDDIDDATERIIRTIGKIRGSSMGAL